MTARIAVVIDVDGLQCGDRCCQQPDPKGGAFCPMFSARLELATMQGVRGKVHVRCPACLRAEKRLRQSISAARVQGRLAAGGVQR